MVLWSRIWVICSFNERNEGFRSDRKALYRYLKKNMYSTYVVMVNGDYEFTVISTPAEWMDRWMDGWMDG